MNSMSKGRRYFIGGSDARIITGDDEAALLRLWREKRGEVEPEERSENWRKTITGRMPVGRYIVTLCYATAVFFLGWWSWNILQILPALPRSNPLGFSAFVPPEESVRSKVFCGRGGSL